MTHNVMRRSTCNWIEYKQSSEQTISTNSVITWDTKKTTGSDSVSIDGSGIITLSPLKRYWLQASVSVQRSTYNTDFQFDFQKGDGTSLDQSEGNFGCKFVWDGQLMSSPYATFPVTNSSLLASLIVNYPTTTYKLVCTNVSANSTFCEESNLFIMEME